jgi:release factor glutamine methyltransferase
MKPNEILGFLSRFQLHEKKEIINFEYNMSYGSFLAMSDLPMLKNDYSTDKPLAYILGYTTFMGHKINVNSNTLIPRIESEILIDFVYEHLKDGMNVLDLCTGSGVLGITLALHNKINLTCADISAEALKVCESNLKLHNIDGQIILGDMFENINDKYDLIVFNPPYVDKSEVLESSVFDYEPHLALFGEQKGLEFYKNFFSVGSDYLNKNGIIILETGDNQFQDIKLMMDGFSNITLIKDMFGRERGIYAVKS